MSLSLSATLAIECKTCCIYILSTDRDMHCHLLSPCLHDTQLNNFRMKYDKWRFAARFPFHVGARNYYPCLALAHNNYCQVLHGYLSFRGAAAALVHLDWGPPSFNWRGHKLWPTCSNSFVINAVASVFNTSWEFNWNPSWRGMAPAHNSLLHHQPHSNRQPASPVTEW